MKNTVEASVISRSQSEANVDKGKMQLVLGTTTKFDSIFPLLDQVCIKTHLPTFFYIISAIYLYYQVIFASLYPINKYWFNVFNDTKIFPSNTKVTNAFSLMEKIAFFFKIELESIETDLLMPIIVFASIFAFSVLIIIFEKFGTSQHHKIRKLVYNIIRFIIDIVSPVILIPSAAVFGISIRNLFLNGNKLNWIYLFVSLIMFFVFLLYTYIGFTILNQSTCIIITPFSSFSIKLSMYLPTICSLFLLFQCIFSLFQYWATVIVQLSHLVVSIIVFYPMCYLYFHNKFANIFFNGVVLSTWLNDINFTILYFISPPSKNINNDNISDKLHFYYLIGFIVPLFTLVISLITAFFYVNLRISSFVKELNRMSENLTDSPTLNTNTDNDDNMDIFNNDKLFKTENLTLMSIHLSFSNCSPLFYKWHIINFAATHFPTLKVLLTIVQYLSFFPGASRLLNNYLKFISQNRDLKYHQRFLLFQIFRIKTMRQSSVSPEANRMLSELKNASTQVFEDIISFWDLKESSVDYLRMIATEITNLNAKWEEAIRDFPNFQRFSDEYCSFLLECKMNVPRALVMKHRSSLIEMGKNFINDVPFFCLAKSYPKYLKNGVIDSQGNFIQNQKEEIINNSASHSINTQNSSTSTTIRTNLNVSNESNSSSMFDSDFDLDPEFEESLGKILFNQSALRIELNRALEHKVNHPSRLMLFNCFIVAIVGFGFLIGLYLYLDSYIEERSFSLMYLNVVSKIRYYIDLAILGSTLKFGFDLKFFSQLKFYLQLNYKDEQIQPPTTNVFNIDGQVAQNVIHQNCIISRTLFNIFISGLADLSSKGLADIYSLTRHMMTNIVPFSVCNNGVAYRENKTSLKALDSYMFLLLDQVAAQKAEMSWFFTDNVCEMMANQQGIEDSTLSLFTSLMEYEVSLSDKEDNIIKYLMIIFTIVPLVAYIVPEGLYMKLFIIDVEKLIKVLLDLSPHYKEIAKKPIRKDSPYNEPQTSEKKVKNETFAIVLFIMIVLCVANSLIIYFMLSETKELNDNIKKLGRWNLIAAVRLSSSVQSLNYLLVSIALDLARSAHLPTPPNAYVNLERMIQKCKYSLTLLENSNEGLLRGTPDFGAPPCKDFDEKIDVVNIQPSCTVENNNNTDMHDSYRCASASQGVSIYVSLIRSILEDLETTGASFESEKITHSLHLLDRHLLQKLEDNNDIYNVIHQERIAGLQKKATILLAFGIILNFLIIIILFYFYFRSLNIYKVGLIYIQRLPPTVYLTNKKLLNFILNRKDNKNESSMSTAQSVIYMSLDGIICTNGSGVVEIINPSVTNILGYTPDQMLGQNISVFFSNLEEENENENKNANNEENKDEDSTGLTGDAERISNQIELMKNGQSALVFQEHFICVTDEEKQMPCGVTILGMTNSHDNGDSSSPGNVESFVFIIRDETQLMQQQKEAEAAKAQSENLLFQILPRDIVTRINSGETDISFTVQSASIIFTDVVKFSEYASSLSPQEIMGSLSTMFAAFDVCAKKYDLITKIKLIGDIYMAAAGLFADENVTPKDHAEQILNFGLDCLTELEDVNLKLNANLQLRVGVNTGGPLLAGVLGTDKPVFDIIGDPINVAARLQTTDVPGKVQMPKSTFDLVNDGGFIIEERGEVFLKGKGKTISYLVTPGSPNAALETATSQQLI